MVGAGCGPLRDGVGALQPVGHGPVVDRVQGEAPVRLAGRPRGVGPAQHVAAGHRGA